MKRLFAVLFVLLLASVSVFAKPVYKYEDTVPLTDTVSLTNVREFHSEYNISYSYIKMDLEDERIKLKLLKSEEGADILSTVPNLAKQDPNTIAAINGDFFSVFSGKKGFSLGIEKVDGTVLQSPINPDTMATVAYDGENVLMSYLDFHVMAVAPNWEYEEIRHINKHTTYYGDILMYTSSFNSGYSPAPGGNVVEVVVENNIITEFRREMEPCKIPENGCVLVVSEGSSMFFANNFSVGDEIKFDWYITPSLDDYEMAFGGGSMLVSEGQDVGKIGDYTHTVAGLNPRSAIGVDKEGKYLYLVAVDGRQSSSRGMRMSHLAELLISLGCYNAVNLDGGGSTNLVASTLWQKEMHSVNSPTENRRVINAVGIVIDDGSESLETDESELNAETQSDEQSEDKKTETDITDDESQNVSGIKIKADRTVSFVGEEISFDVVAHNELLRQVSFDTTELVWEASSGRIDDGILTCGEGGKVTVGVTFDGFYASTEVYYIEHISGIDTDDAVFMEEGHSREIPIYVFDSKGRYVKVSNTEAFEIASSNENVVTVENDRIFAKNSGTAIVSVSYGDAVSYIAVAVGRKSENYHYGFERLNGDLFLYPADTKGDFELTNTVSLSGDFSGKLSFDFTVDSIVSDEHETKETEDVPRAVYYSLNENILIDEECKTAYVSVCPTLDFKHKVKAQIVDGDGNAKNVDFEGEVLAGEWSRLSLTVPEDVKRPVYLSKVYVLYTPGEEQDTGSIYFDDISLITSKKNETPIAPMNVYRFNKLNSNVTSSMLFGAVMQNVNNPVSVYRTGMLEKKVVSENGFVISENIEKGVSEDDNAVYVYLDTSDGGIRNTDSSQWDMLINAVENSKCENLFLVVNNSIFGSDEFENEVICDYLSSIDKEVFVVSRGNASDYKNINGVRYFEIDSTPATTLLPENGGRKNALRFDFGEVVSFEFETI